MRRVHALALVPILGCAVLAACSSHSKPSPAQTAAQRFLDALGRGDVTAASAATSDPNAAADPISSSLRAMGNPTGSLRVTSVHGDTAMYSASWKLPGTPTPWTYQGTLALAQHDDSWTVTWAPNDIHPGLRAGEHLLARRTQPPRAALEDAAGRPLFAETPVVYVGIEPKLVKNLASLAATLARTLHISAADIAASVKAAPSKDAFVDVITLRQSAYQKVRAIIHPLPGTVFKTGTELLAPTSRFAQPLLGHVGPATADTVKASSGRIQVGDQAGIDGLQQVFDAQLSGTPAIAVYAADADGRPGRRLDTVGAPKPGRPVQLTLDRTVQTAADNALQSVPQAAAIVALQASTGRILAVANSASTPGDIALAGQYPPGSTYKIVTATAALAGRKLTANTPEACPATKTVDGRVFVNEDKFSLGTVSLRTAFAMSCNTTFMTLGMTLPPTALATAGRQLGLGEDWKLPVESFSGSLPTPTQPTEQAAEAIGQGKILASPLAMAEVAGTAQTGRPIAPSLVVGQQAQPGPALPAAVTATLHDMMRATVTSGRATDLNDLPGQVAGKTGTAEYDNSVPPRSHGWFAGYRGDLAFAVFVYDGQTSKVAVAITRRFLAAVP
ncbi:MAG TPA: penicillin-binding transpeptidase domain-containing protein [Jatrophihabitantaceae bacterium]